ncbi:MAG: hypothetical protein KJO87_03110, partial [Acidimicrobiia bacterium]|nr:hypothetical protein [Acidimicrobiia bacterium]
AAACGGDDGEAGDATTTTAGNGATTTTAADATTTTTEAASGDSNSAYCERVREAADSDETPLDFTFFGLSPEQLQAQFEKNLEIFEDWVDIAPREIEDDAQVVLDFYRRFIDLGNELNWDLEAMADSEEFNTAFDDPALDAATLNLDNFTENVCGVVFNDPASDPGTSSGDDPLADLATALGIPIPLNILDEATVECLTTELEPLLTADIGPGYVPTEADFELLTTALEACGLG